MAKSKSPTHPDGWWDRGKKAYSHLMGDTVKQGNVRGGGGPGPMNAGGGGGKAKGCGPNYSNDYDTMPSGYKSGRK